jgi:hypothetical protein
VQELISSHSATRYVIETSLSALPFRFLPWNIGTASDDHGKRFLQDISQTEKRYGGKWNPNMSADCCWSLVMETPTAENKGQRKKRVFNDFFSSKDTVCRDTVHYLILYTGIRK